MSPFLFHSYCTLLLLLLLVLVFRGVIFRGYIA
jgi:hypothetical protein